MSLLVHVPKERLARVTEAAMELKASKEAFEFRIATGRTPRPERLDAAWCNLYLALEALEDPLVGEDHVA